MPHESLLLVGLGGARRRVGLTVRVDLHDAWAGRRGAVASVGGSGATACLVAVVTDQPSTGHDHPHADLVHACGQLLAEAGLAVPEALLVRGGRWWSYRCSAACCPPEGTPVDTGSSAVLATAAHAAYAGQVVLASRAELVASLQPRLPLGAAVVRRLQDQALEALLERARSAPQHAEDLEVARWRDALDRWEAEPSSLAPDSVAALAVALHLPGVRDRVAVEGLRRREGLLGLLTQLCRAATAPGDAPLLALLAAAAYTGGNGALALVALDRALASDPDCRLARLLLAALDSHLPPDQVRAAFLDAA